MPPHISGVPRLKSEDTTGENGGIHPELEAQRTGRPRFRHTFTKIGRRKDRRGVDLISDALPFGKLWYTEPNAVSNAIGYAQSMAVFEG